MLSNKVFKHVFVTEMEEILDNGDKVTHSKLSDNVGDKLMDPSSLAKVSLDSCDTCYAPVIQSGGKYDIKVSAVSDDDTLSADVILCSLGSRFRGYCSHMSRTFMVDAPSKIEQTYSTLLALYQSCLEKVVVGNEYKDVLAHAKSFLASRDAALANHLAKSLGFAVGLEFRDSSQVLNANNSNKFCENQVFTLSVGFHNVPLSAEDKAGAASSIQKLEAFSLLLADTILVQKDGSPEVLTKYTKEFGEVSYNISGEDDEDDEDGEGDGQDKDANGGLRRSSRSKEEKMQQENLSMQRQQKQQELMRKKIAEAQKKLEKMEAGEEEEEEEEEVADLEVYKSPADYPRDVQPNLLRVDFDKECLIVPVNGQPVPFHISTIKNINMPDPDRATYLRINFYATGMSLGKDVPKNTIGLVAKYGDRVCFIKELTFRSLSTKNLGQVHMQFQELRKRVRAREQKAEQEKDLVVQGKLIRIKDQRVPKLQDVTMRPTITGRKCNGTLEAHQNGVRFTSTKHEVLDILYDNIKHAIYQPCDVKTSMVIVHFHLKDFIMVGKKKQRDIQFLTEVVDSSLSLDASKRSAYDPDEIDEEQREREMRRRLNAAFKDFCLKLEKVASHYDHTLNVDVPFVKSAFEANVHREMVRLMPTTHCLVNLTEVPNFCQTISDIEHVHFERAGFTTKAFDIVLVFKDWSIAPKTLTAIDIKYMDIVQEWLNLVEITYTIGSQPMNWTEVMAAVKEDDRFWYDTEADGETKKPHGAGWKFLNVEGSDDEEEGEDEDEESAFDDKEEGSTEESESGSDSDDESDFDEEDSDEEEDDDSEEEEGKDWDELERDAAAADKAKRSYEDEPIDPRKAKKARR